MTILSILWWYVCGWRYLTDWKASVGSYLTIVILPLCHISTNNTIIKLNYVHQKLNLQALNIQCASQ